MWQCLGPIGRKAVYSCLASVGTFSSKIVHSHFDYDVFNSDSVSSSEGESSRVLDDNYSLHYLIGSCGARHHVDPPNLEYVSLGTFNVCVAQFAMFGSIDVVEVFGGESGVGTCCARRRLRRGEKFDLVIGFDLTKEFHQSGVSKYTVGNAFAICIFGPHVLGLDIGRTLIYTPAPGHGASLGKFANFRSVHSTHL